MALPYLPKEHILSSFHRLREMVPVSNRLMIKFMAYINENWMCNETFPVKSWCVFGQPTRTNNDVEGWHNRLNRKARGASLHLYVMIKLLSDEAQCLPMQIKLVSEKKLTRTQRTTTKRIQAELFLLWENYTNQEISVSTLLKSVGQLIGPTVTDE